MSNNPYRDPPEGGAPSSQRARTINPDGSIRVETLGAPARSWTGDLYHFLLRTSWLGLLGMFFAGYVAANCLFACLYLLGDGTISGGKTDNFISAFFFSVQTMSTVGYGRMEPVGTYANVLATVETFVGLLGFAIATGLAFAKFARPSARVMFAKRAVVGMLDGVPTLSVRMANIRGNQIYEASVRVSVLRDVELGNGETMRRFFDLELVRNSTPIFAMTWTAMHIIDERSPLYGLDNETLAATDAMLLVNLHGTDETFVQPVHARAFFFDDDICWGCRYVDVLERADNGLRLHLDRFHDVEPLDEATRAALAEARAAQRAPVSPSPVDEERSSPESSAPASSAPGGSAPASSPSKSSSSPSSSDD